MTECRYACSAFPMCGCAIEELHEPRRIQLRRTKGWKIPDNTVKVDRTTIFGNPFPVRLCFALEHGVTRRWWSVGTWRGPGLCFKDTHEEAVALAVQAYRAWIAHPQQETLREKAVVALRGKNLACWCPLPKEGENDCCHAAVLLEIVNGPLPAVIEANKLFYKLLDEGNKA